MTFYLVQLSLFLVIPLRAWWRDLVFCLGHFLNVFGRTCEVSWSHTDAVHEKKSVTSVYPLGLCHQGVIFQHCPWLHG